MPGGELMVRVGIVGGSGYVGGELLRLLLDHPHVEVTQVTSERHAGRYVHFLHPNLRGRASGLRFISARDLAPCDLLFLCLPHGRAQTQIEAFATLAPRLIDLSADFRLRDPEAYIRWYGQPHVAPEWLSRFVYGLPELYREEIAGASYVSGVGCNATAAILGLWPLFRAGLTDPARDVIVEVKVGSSEGGATASPASHHPERSGAVRSFAPTGHRHTAEVIQALTLAGPPPTVHLSATAVEMVRGVLATAHVFLRDPELAERDLWVTYREAYAGEPFIRIVKERRGVYRYPEPKILAGSNYCDVGFALDPEAGRVVVISALDNLMKGGAGTAVQCMNLMFGWPETTGLTFPGLHPI
jgi:N-acetyl-gamma-glutamyl-phosphate/LysW-gamma-L-alpha-aminoadipyl-6-phosphate reductase